MPPTPPYPTKSLAPLRNREGAALPEPKCQRRGGLDAAAWFPRLVQTPPHLRGVRPGLQREARVSQASLDSAGEGSQRGCSG